MSELFPVSKTPLTFTRLAPYVIKKLSGIGIYNLESLTLIGSVKAFLLLKTLNFSINYRVLYFLEAAVLGVNWTDLTDCDRSSLRQMAINHYPVRLPPDTDQIETFMLEAQSLANEASKLNEVPVGCVIVKDGLIIGKGFNLSVSMSDPVAHAEIIAMRQAAKSLANYRLDGCDLYVTLEPCAMCAGAIIQSRIARLMFGVCQPKTGAAGGVINLFANTKLNKHTAVFPRLSDEICKKQMQDFFAKRREKKK